MNIDFNNLVKQNATTSNNFNNGNGSEYPNLQSARNAFDADLAMAIYNSDIMDDEHAAFMQQMAFAKELSLTSNPSKFSLGQGILKDDDDAFLRHSTYDMGPIKESLTNEGCFMVQVSGENNNCLFRSILTSLLYHGNSSEEIEQTASFLREIYDEEVPNERGKSLYFDNSNSNNGEGGSAASIIKLINTNFNINISVEVITPNPNIANDGIPYITSEAYLDNAPNNNELLKLRIFQDTAHFQSVVKNIYI